MEEKKENNREIYINVGDWRLVSLVLIICTTSVFLSRIWSSYMESHERLAAASQLNDVYMKNVPALNRAMGGPEFPPPPKKVAPKHKAPKVPEEV